MPRKRLRSRPPSPARQNPIPVTNLPQSPAPSTLPTFASVVEEFLGSYATSTLKASTRRGYKVVFDAFLVPRVGDRPIDQITPDVVRELDAELAKRGAARSTRRNMQLALRSVLCRFCVERRLLPELPPMPKLPRVGNHVLRVPTDDEVTHIFGVVPERFHLALLIGRFAGLRAGEIRALRWRHVDLSRGHLVVEESTCRGVTDVPKSGHQRIIPLAAPLPAALSAVPRRPREGFVTCGSDGKQWSEDALSKAFSRYARRALVEGVSLHSLRHHFVTTLFKRGVGAPTVQALAGHLHLSTTRRYARAPGRPGRRHPKARW